jgi:phosphohistidine swiveling domain-containing protein
MKLIEQRRVGSLFFLYSLGVDVTADTTLKNNISLYIPQPFRFLKTSCSNDELCWFLDEDDLVDGGTRILKEFFDRPHQANLFFDFCERNFERYELFCEQLNKKRMSTLTTSQIVDYINKSFELYIVIENPGTGFEMLDFSLPVLLRKELEKQVPNNEIAKIITTMSTADETSFSRSAEKSLLEIAAYIKENKIKNPFSDKKVMEMITAHIDAFYWTACNYFVYSGLGRQNVETIISNYIVKDPRRILDDFEKESVLLEEEKKKILKKFKLSKRAQYYFEMAQRTSLGFDMRKKAQMHGFFAVGRFLKELAKRVKVDFDLAKYLIPEEIELFSQGKINPQILYERRQHCFVDYNVIPLKVLRGKEAKRAEQGLWAKADDTTNEIGGVCASPGTAVARARVITSARATGEIKQGEILVTGMTTPDYVPALKKIVGIITDDGGITSHAAIIARELKIPAVVGTRTATKKIKTGDLIELRANHGLVRIIERA